MGPHLQFGHLAVPELTLPSASRNEDLSLSISSCPVLARLVQMIQSGKYKDIWDQLWRSAAVRFHYEDLQGGMGV